MTLRFEPLLEAFDDAPLRDFVKDKDVFAIRDHFFLRKEVPYLAVVVTYGLRASADPAARAVAADSATGRDSSWRAQIAEADLPLFNALRDWRAERAKREGIPPYLICTNKQLAEMIALRPQSISKLSSIHGIGRAKIEKYGQDLLAFLARPRVSEDSGSGSVDSDSAVDDAASRPPIALSDGQGAN